MRNKLKFILDVGSSSLRLIAVSVLLGKQRIVAEDAVLYDGYMDGEFLSPETLEQDLQALIEKMSAKMRMHIKSIVVGVPSEFCISVCKRISRKYIKPHKILGGDLIKLYQNNADFGSSEDYRLISFSPIQCVLDDGYQTLSPIGKKTTSLVLDASYILVKNTFLNTMTETLKNLGVLSVDFVSSALGQAMVCERKKDDDKPFAIVDVGHISTSVAVCKGEGLVLLTSFAMGGGHVSSDLMQVLSLKYREAELIKRKVILTIDSRKNEHYEVCHKGNLIKAPINLTNQIVKSRIEMISNVVKDILSIDKVFADVDIYLTGDGISNFKGVKNIMQDITGRNVYYHTIPFDNSSKKFQTSKLGLVRISSEIVQEAKNG